MLIAKPEIKVQQRIVDISKSYSVKIEVERQYRNKIKLQKKGLMHDLLTGKVSVKVDGPVEYVPSWTSETLKPVDLWKSDLILHTERFM